MNETNTHTAGCYAGVTALIALGQVIFSVQFSALNVALATIAKDLGAEATLLPWVISTYSLTYAGFLVLGGRTADRFGRRRFCIFGLLLFALGLLIGILAMDAWMLIGASALEGFGSAFFVPASFSLINVALPEGRIRHRAFAVFGATQGIALILGFCGGGFVITTFGWRAVFLINLPLVIAAISLAWRFIPAQREADRKRGVDVGGAVLITAVAVLALTSLSAMEVHGSMSLQGLGLLGTCVVALGAFVLLERNLRDPLVPPSVYGHLNFLGASIASVGAVGAVGCCFALLNLFMQRVLHFTAMQSGLGMLPYAFAFIVTSRFILRSMSKYSLRLIILSGFPLTVIGTLLFAIGSPHPTYGLNVIPALMLVGVGSCITVTLLTALCTAAVPVPDQGVAIGVLMTFQQIALALGVQIGIIVVTAGAQAGDSTITSFRQGFFAASAMAVIGLLCTLLFTRNSMRSPARRVFN